jgi:hypothetical protein
VEEDEEDDEDEDEHEDDEEKDEYGLSRRTVTHDNHLSPPIIGKHRKFSKVSIYEQKMYQILWLIRIL